MEQGGGVISTRSHTQPASLETRRGQPAASRSRSRAPGTWANGGLIGQTQE